MQLLPPFPDAELVVCELLSSVAPTVTSTSSTDEPVIRINRTGGDDDYITDFPVVQVMCFAPDQPNTTSGSAPAIPGRELAWQMAEQCRQIILASVRKTVTYTDPGGNEITALIDNAQKAATPIQPPYGNQDVRSVTASYRLSMRRPKTTA